MTLENKLGIHDSAELAREEERISKKKALELFESGYLNTLEAGTYRTLARIHNIFLGTFTALQENYGKEILPKEISASSPLCIFRQP